MIHGYYLSFPVLQIALFMAVATAALPYLARGVQRLIEIFIALVALASAVGEVTGCRSTCWAAWPSAGGRRRWSGSSSAHRSACLRPMMCGCCWASSASARPTCARYRGRSGGWRNTRPPRRDRAGSPGRLGISVYGRDAADAKLLTKAGRFLLYRDSGPSLTITRLQQVEHEAYLTLRAGQAGVAVPEIVEAGTAGPSRDALLVYRLAGRDGRCPTPTPPRSVTPRWTTCTGSC